jgi:hypothetical protein
MQQQRALLGLTLTPDFETAASFPASSRKRRHLHLTQTQWTHVPPNTVSFVLITTRTWRSMKTGDVCTGLLSTFRGPRPGC